MYVTVQIPEEELKYIQTCLTMHIEKWKEEVKHTENILKELDEALKKAKEGKRDE